MDKVVEATSAYNITWKTTTRFTPYELVYGKKDFLSVEFEFNTLRMAAQLDLVALVAFSSFMALVDPLASQASDVVFSSLT